MARIQHRWRIEPLHRNDTYKERAICEVCGLYRMVGKNSRNLWFSLYQTYTSDGRPLITRRAIKCLTKVGLDGVKVELTPSQRTVWAHLVAVD